MTDVLTTKYSAYFKAEIYEFINKTIFHSVNKLQII